MPTIKALVPLDQSSRDRIILPHILTLAQTTAAKVYLLHVVSTMRAVAPGAIRAAEAHMDAFEQHMRAEGVDAHGIVRNGDPATEIANVAAEYEINLIVMGTRGRRGMDRLLLGSVADAVLSSCPFPVMLINESTARTSMDDKVRTQSSYLAGVIWNRVARGFMSEAQADAEILRLQALGLDHDALTSSYASMKESGAPAEWLDLDFQTETLSRYLPELLSDKTIRAA